jgi:hypothetical protein
MFPTLHSLYAIASKAVAANKMAAKTRDKLIDIDILRHLKLMQKHIWMTINKSWTAIITHLGDDWRFRTTNVIIT